MTEKEIDDAYKEERQERAIKAVYNYIKDNIKMPDWMQDDDADGYLEDEIFVGFYFDEYTICFRDIYITLMRTAERGYLNLIHSSCNELEVEDLRFVIDVIEHKDEIINVIKNA